MKQTMKLWMLAAFFTCVTAGAQAQQAVNTENGKVVKHITFDREQVNITYADGTADEGVQQACIRRDNTATGIHTIGHSSLTPGYSIYDLQGRKIANGQRSAANGKMTKGIYIRKEGNKASKLKSQTSNFKK